MRGRIAKSAICANLRSVSHAARWRRRGRARCSKTRQFGAAGSHSSRIFEWPFCAGKEGCVQRWRKTSGFQKLFTGIALVLRLARRMLSLPSDHRYFFPALAGHYSRTHRCSGQGLRLFIQPYLRRAVSISRPFFWASFPNWGEARFFCALCRRSHRPRVVCGCRVHAAFSPTNIAIRGSRRIPGKIPEPGPQIVRFRWRHLKSQSSRPGRDLAYPGFHGKGQSCQNKTTNRNKQHSIRTQKNGRGHWPIHRCPRHSKAQSVLRGIAGQAVNRCR